MDTKIIEASQGDSGPNWGKFMLAKLTPEEWATPSTVADGRIMQQIGFWTYDETWVWVMDLQTREGAFFHVGRGFARADLEKHKIWVCPMYEPFLEWLYSQDVGDLDALPTTVHLPDAPAAFQGYRRAAVETWLREPETWEQVAEAIGEHDYTYDLSDGSHRRDVVQIVCETLSKVASQAHPV